MFRRSDENLHSYRELGQRLVGVTQSSISLAVQLACLLDSQSSPVHEYKSVEVEIVYGMRFQTNSILCSPVKEKGLSTFMFCSHSSKVFAWNTYRAQADIPLLTFQFWHNNRHWVKSEFERLDSMNILQQLCNKQFGEKGKKEKQQLGALYIDCCQ